MIIKLIFIDKNKKALAKHNNIMYKRIYIGNYFYGRSRLYFLDLVLVKEHEMGNAVIN